MNSPLITDGCYNLSKLYEKCYSCLICPYKSTFGQNVILPSDYHPFLVDIPVIVNGLYGDPIYYSEDTIQMLDSLQEVGHKGIVVIQTKGDIDSVSGRRIFEKRWDGINIAVVLSYFGNPSYNRGTMHILENNLEYLSQLNYECAIQHDGIVKGINDDDFYLKNIFTLAEKYGKNIIVKDDETMRILTAYRNRNPQYEYVQLVNKKDYFFTPKNYDNDELMTLIRVLPFHLSIGYNDNKEYVFRTGELISKGDMEAIYAITGVKVEANNIFKSPYLTVGKWYNEKD